jgi:hypothetical protein
MVRDDLIYDDAVRLRNQYIQSTRNSIRGYACRQRLARCELPRRFHDGRIILQICFTVIFCVVLWGGFIGKLASESFLDFIEHYTNWVWSICTFFFTALVISLMMATRWMEMQVLFIFLWPTMFNTWVMFFLVFLMLLSNPGTITDNFKENGGDFDPGVVFNADRLFHVIPPFFVLITIFVLSTDIREMYDVIFDKQWRDHFKRPFKVENNTVFYYIFLMSAFSVLPFFVYYNAFDFHVVYSVSTPLWAGLLVVIAVLILAVIMPIVYFTPITQLRNIDNRGSWVTDGINPSQEDIDAYLEDHPHMREHYE